MERVESLQVRSLSLLSGVLLLVVLVLVNVALARTHTRLDLTEEGRYTLADGSRRILAQLRDPAEVQVFWHGVPIAQEGAKRYVEALLDEMGDASGGRLTTTWVDMSGEAGRKIAEEVGVPEYVFGAIESDEFRQSRGYMSLALSMGDGGTTIIDRLADVRDQLEYRIVADLQQRVRTAPPVVALVQDLGGARDFTHLGEALRSGFGEGMRLGLTLDKPVPEDVQVLILAAPTDVPPLAAYHFEQFLLRGGRGIVLLDPVDIAVAQGQSGYRSSGLEDWLRNLGVESLGGIVEDFERPGRMIAQDGLVAYPPWVVAVPPKDATNVLAASLPQLVMRWPGALRIDAARQTETGRTVTPLYESSANAYRRPDTLGLMSGIDSAAGKRLEKHVLGALVEGPVTSFWKDKPLPKAEEPADEALPPGMPPFHMPGGEATDPGSPDGDAEGSPDGLAPPPPPEQGTPEEGPRGPEGPEGDEGAPAPAPAPVPEPAPAAEPENREDHVDSGDVRLVVLGDADLVRDLWVPTAKSDMGIRILAELNGGVQGGFSAVINATDWMTGSDDLLALRARADKPRTLPKLEPGDREAVEWLNILAVPLLMLLVGIVVWVVRGSD
ncbi:MAG: GldG family protein [Planctomycetes bacterium]|nr:GldG family protein [Planctomycetota bacterium]MCB9824736.1 GldG family protein [Planctomycetota bacterium]MCB9899853.1 GldG family protein [Planctomycetota bacterium]